jgi:hypothetical protein
MKTIRNQTNSLNQGHESRRLKKIVMLLLVAFLFLASFPQQAAAASICQPKRVTGDIKIAWLECPADANSGILYRSTNDGFGGWQYWGGYTYAPDGMWEYLLHRDGVSWYLQNRYTAQYFFWNGYSWIAITYSQIAW